MEEGTVAKWYKKVGDMAKKGTFLRLKQIKPLWNSKLSRGIAYRN